MSTAFGKVLRDLRLTAGFGLRRFAGMVDLEPSNLSAIEHGRRCPPTAKLQEIADALGLVENSANWQRFFDAAARDGELPADLRHVTRRRLVPALLRTIDNRQLGDDEIRELIREIERRHGTDSDATP